MELESDEHKKFINDLKVSIITGMVTNIVLQSELTTDVDKIANTVLENINELIKDKTLFLTEKMKKLIYKSVIIGITLKNELDDFDRKTYQKE